MIVIDREYAIQLMMKDDLYNVPRLQELLFNGFVGYDNMKNEELLTIYNESTNKPVNKVV